ncbi:MAG: metal-dependent hydrolase [Anaerolineales bacterium]
MPQNGLHALAGVAARHWIPQREWLVLGVVLGNMFPDLDNLAVAYATLTKADSHGLHRTFTHSIFTILAIIVLFYLIAALTKNQKWNNLGLGLGVGILMHILLDLILWFNGVEILWPIRYELNFWRWFAMPDWLKIILDTGEFLAFGFYFLVLGSLARRQNTDGERQRSTKTWAYVQLVLFILFTVLFFTAGATGLPYTIFGGLYLVSMVIAVVLTIQMRKTIETLS